MASEIEVAAAGDARELAQLHSTTVGIAYADIFPPGSQAPTADDLAESWSDALSEPSTDVFIVRSERRRAAIVASVVFGPDASAPSGFLLGRLHVHPDHQGQGIGSRLHQRVVDEAVARNAREINLWVLEHNTRARTMYERRGWILIPGPTFANDPPHIVDVLYQLSLGV